MVMDRHIEIKESEIREKVRRNIQRDERLFNSDINVAVKGNTVSLEGKVPSPHALRAAENDAYRVMGVRTVENYLLIDPPAHYKQPTDLEIEESVRSTLTWNNQVDSTDIDISINNGLVTLSGTVQEYVSANAAHDALLYIPGVRGIVNNINIG
jgi:osmotically-inducible protein OsmY